MLAIGKYTHLLIDKLSLLLPPEIYDAMKQLLFLGGCSLGLLPVHRCSFQRILPWELTTTIIHQTKPDSSFKQACYGGGVDLKYSISPAIGIYGIYRLIYDTAPIVPIRKAYNAVETGLSISF